MGGSLSTIRWTPDLSLDQLQGGNRNRHNNRDGRHKLHKSKSYPPPGGSNINNNNGSQSPSSSTTNLTYDTDEDDFHNSSNHSSSAGGEHLGTSGILMGINAPPLYDACLVGRWDEVLEICGVVTTDGLSPSSNSAASQTATTQCSSLNSGLKDSFTSGVGVVGSDGIVAAAEKSGDGEEEGEGEDEEEEGGDNTATLSELTEFPRDGRASFTTEASGDNIAAAVAADATTSTAVAITQTSPAASNTTQLSTNHPCLQTRYIDRRRNTPLHLACRRQPPPSVIRALLNHSPCGTVSRRTADGLTPLHFAAYCGADVEVVSLLVDRMRSDAAVSKAAKLSLALTLVETVDELDEEEKEDDEGDGDKKKGKKGRDKKKDDNKKKNESQFRLPNEEPELPPTRLMDRRNRTPLHCALSGFRTPIRPLIVRKLLAVDPASSTLSDERGRTPLSLLFDDYAEEIMEALEDDVSASDLQVLISKGGDLYECWKMLRVLLEGAYHGSVCEDEQDDDDDDMPNTTTTLSSHLGGHVGTISEDTSTTSLSAAVAAVQPPPQDQSQGMTTTTEMYDREQFSMVHAAAGVWECPAPLAKLVLKCLCSTGNTHMGTNYHNLDDSSRYYGADDWDHSVDVSETPPLESDNGNVEKDIIRQRDKETMRLPLHIAVCARPICCEGYSARLRVWLSSTPEATRTNMPRPPSIGSLASGITTNTLATHPDRRGRSANTTPNKGQVYNPRFGRSPSRDNVVAYSSSQRRMSNASKGELNSSSAASTAGSLAGSLLSRSGSNSSISANIAREPFLQHTMVCDILELYPVAASIIDDRTGKLPIVLAIEHGKSWEMAVGPLLEAYPTPFGGGGDGGMALPDHSDEGKAHRAALQNALFVALSSPEVFVREEAIRTAGKLVSWGGVYGMMGSLDGIVCEWLDMIIHSSSSSTTPEGIIVGPGAAASSESDCIQIQSSHLTAVAEVVSNARQDSISDRVARLCLDTSREYLFSKDGTVREAASRVLGNTLNSVGDADDAANVMRELVLNLVSDEGSVVSGSTGGLFLKEDVITKHGKLLACNSILSTQWGCELMATEDIRTAVISFIHKSVKDRNTVVRSAAYHAIGPILGKSNVPDDVEANKISPSIPMILPTMATLKELRRDILKGTRASENVDVQLALARGLTSASRMYPNLFLCKSGMPIMDATLMLAMSSSSAARSANVQKAFQIFLWVALDMGSNQNDDAMSVRSGSSIAADTMSPGLEKYIELAEGENGRIMMKFVTQTLAKIEDLEVEEACIL